MKKKNVLNDICSALQLMTEQNAEMLSINRRTLSYHLATVLDTLVGLYGDKTEELLMALAYNDIPKALEICNSVKTKPATAPKKRGRKPKKAE